VTIVEFSDFQCPFCARVTPTLAQLRSEYPDEVRVIFKHLPLPMHPQAEPAARAAISAGLQDKFWEMHDLLFGNPARLDTDAFVAHATSLNLDVSRLVTDMGSASVDAIIEGDGAEAARLGVTATPSFFVNGKFVAGAIPYESFKRLVEAELANAR